MVRMSPVRETIGHWLDGAVTVSSEPGMLSPLPASPYSAHSEAGHLWCLFFEGMGLQGGAGQSHFRLLSEPSEHPVIFLGLYLISPTLGFSVYSLRSFQKQSLAVLKWKPPSNQTNRYNYAYKLSFLRITLFLRCYDYCFIGKLKLLELRARVPHLSSDPLAHPQSSS